MLEIIKYCFIFLFTFWCNEINAENRKSLIFNEDHLDFNIVGRKSNIYADDITVEWFFSKSLMDLRHSTIFDILGLNCDEIYNVLNNKIWFLGSCENVKNTGAKELNREWKGDIPENINAGIFVPTSIVNGNAKHLHTLLHRIIALAIYDVIKREIKKEKGKQYADTVKVKWINDVIVNGKKICGIKPDDALSNNKVVCFQFGINVNMSKSDLAKIDQPATSLSVECDKHLDHEQILREIVIEIIKLVKKYRYDEIGLDNEFSSKMAFIGEPVIVYDYIPGKNIEGILNKVSGGRLYIKLNNGKICCILPGYGKLRLKNQS